MAVSERESTMIKKKKNLTHIEGSGAVAKSYMTNGLLIYVAHFLIY